MGRDAWVGVRDRLDTRHRIPPRFGFGLVTHSLLQHSHTATLLLQRRAAALTRTLLLRLRLAHPLHREDTELDLGPDDCHGSLVGCMGFAWKYLIEEERRRIL